MKEILSRLREVASLLEILSEPNHVLEVKGGLIVGSLSGEIIYMSPGACEIFEHGPEKVIGEKIEALMPERYRQMHREALARVAEGAPSTLAGKNLSLTGLTASGREIAVLIRIEVREGGDLGKVFVARIYSYPDVDRSVLLRIEGREQSAP